MYSSVQGDSSANGGANFGKESDHFSSTTKTSVALEEWQLRDGADRRCRAGGGGGGVRASLQRGRLQASTASTQQPSAYVALTSSSANLISKALFDKC